MNREEVMADMMSEAAAGRRSGATILPFRRRATLQTPGPILMARTIELYGSRYPTPHQMVLLVESWLFAAQRDGMTVRRPDYIAALRRVITVLRFSKSIAEAVALLRKQEAELVRRR
jgi:hypothetical protein